MIIYLAMFFRRHQLMFRIGLFYCAAPLSGAFGTAQYRYTYIRNMLTVLSLQQEAS